MKPRAAASWFVSALLIVGSIWLWQSRQWVVDAIAYHQYEPTAAVRQIATESKMTDDAKFTFYASRPEVQSSDLFNANCERKEADSPILGCYSARRIYIFDVTDERLDGIETVTAAHEMLHAAWERLPESERTRLTPLLEAAYGRLTNEDLKARMDYYGKAEPGQSINELHSIIGTEYESIGPELEAYYGQYFTNRVALVNLHEEVEAVFDELKLEAKELVARIDQLASSINKRTAAYNADVAQLNADVAAFNVRAQRQGGFTSQSEFEAALAQLNARQSQLEAVKRSIQADIVMYNSLVAQLDAINAESADLNKSLDSTLQDIPAI